MYDLLARVGPVLSMISISSLLNAHQLPWMSYSVSLSLCSLICKNRDKKSIQFI